MSKIADQKLQTAAAARADFLDGRDPRESGPARIRGAVVDSWERSHAAGVNAAQPHSDYTADVDTDSLLARCARPVLEQLEIDSADLPIVAVLIDENARIIRRMSTSRAVERQLDQVDLAPGFDYGESRMGTNGIGTVYAVGQPFSVVGPEHYSENLQLFGCAGAPILDPTTGRIAGVIDITTMADEWNPLFKSVVKNAAKDIGRSLMLDRGQGDHAVLDAYLQAIAESPGRAVLAFGDLVAVANPLAQELFDADERRTLQEYAVSLMAGKAGATATGVAAIAGGQRLINLRGTRVRAGSGTVGVVLIVDPVSDERLRSPAPRMKQPALITPARTGPARIGLHGTGHTWGPDRSLLRVDVINGRWTATRFKPDMTIDKEVTGTEESVHEQVNRWAAGLE